MKKDENLKEKFKQALISTIKAISEDFNANSNLEQKNNSSKNYNFFELDNLNNKYDFLRLRAETDSEALKRKFSNKEIYLKNLPTKPTLKALYKNKFAKYLLTATTILVTATVAQAREQIRIVGSSTVYPFATVVAEKFGISSKFKTPVVESTG